MVKRLIKIFFVFLFIVGISGGRNFVQALGNDNFEVGCGSADITGPSAEIVMMGYADSGQTDRGIHTRLRARSFIVKDNDNGKRVVFVSTDTGMLFQSIKQGVVQKLNENGFGNLYGFENVMISAIHTHSGPAGYAHHGLYNVSSLGHIEQNYQVIVEGIYNSIIEAHNNLEPGYIEISQGECHNTSVNRSEDAYLRNPEEERALYQYNVNKEMVVLTFKNNDNKLLGVVNWFGVHPVSMGMDNRYISGDNKGLASYLMEKEMGVDYSQSDSFVAAFAQGSAGDVSPNIYGGDKGYGDNDFESTFEAAKIQLNALKSIMGNGQRVQGNVDFRYENVDFFNHTIEGEFTDGVQRRTYPAAMGYSFAAGADDQRTSLYPFFDEGMTQPEYGIDEADNYNKKFISVLRLAPKFNQLNGNKYPEMWEEQYPKPILFATSKAEPHPWTPKILPIQMFKIGDVSLVAFPCEVTTMSGRRTERIITEKLNNLTGRNNKVIVSSLANSYSSYLTTPEEYDGQSYEGASTQFGKWTLSAYIQEFSKLAEAIVNDEPVDRGPEFMDLSDEQVTFETPVIYDTAPIGKEFGEVKEQVNNEYNRGESVKVQFWAAHPNNNLLTEDSFLQVQKKEGNSWVTVAHDWDWETKFRWERKSVVLGTSIVEIIWDIPEASVPGTYRITYKGSRKTLFGNIKDFNGVSGEFEVR